MARLQGRPGGPLAEFSPAGELDPPAPRARGEAAGAGRAAPRIDGQLLDDLASQALGGARGAVFTPAAEARLLAAFGLAHAAARRGGPAPEVAVGLLLAGVRGEARTALAQLTAALTGLTVLDPACGGGALLVAAEGLARGVGARLVLRGLDLAPLAVRATRARLALLGASATVTRADALGPPWPRCDLLLANPPFLRHEAIPPAQKAAATRLTGLSRQADLSAHLAVLALRRAPVAALLLPRALFTSRSAEPLLAEARARGGFALRLRSSAAGSFAASVDTLLAVWSEGGREAPAAEAGVPLEALRVAELQGLARALAGQGARPSTTRLRLDAPPPPRRGGAAAPKPPARLGDLCLVRFGLKSGCNAFFHLAPLGGGRYRSPLLGEVALEPSDVAPLLAGLKEADAPERLRPALVLFRPRGEPSPAALAYLARGEAAGLHRRPTCRGRSPWWRLAPGREPAPLLYPAKVGARAFAVLNEGGLLEDKKWHALFPQGAPAWPLALVLSATPVRLAIDEGARQLTGAQAIADVDCRVLAAAPVPTAETLAALAPELVPLRDALGQDLVTTDLAAMLERPAQRALDLLVGRALGLGARAVEGSRRALLERVEGRLRHAGAVRRRSKPGPAAPR